MTLRRRLLGASVRLLALGLAAPLATAAAEAQGLYDRALVLLCGRRRDPVAAAALLEQAARQGHRGAQGLLGWMAMSGVGMPRDDAKAARWLRPAAEAGDTAAQNNLGVLHAVGSGVPHDHAQAERWFRAAAAQGADDAADNLRELLRSDTPGASAPSAARTSRARLPPALQAAGCRPRRT